MLRSFQSIAYRVPSIKFRHPSIIPIYSWECSKLRMLAIFRPHDLILGFNQGSVFYRNIVIICQDNIERVESIVYKESAYNKLSKFLILQ